jgi:hypothetical protein
MNPLPPMFAVQHVQGRWALVAPIHRPHEHRLERVLLRAGDHVQSPPQSLPYRCRSAPRTDMEPASTRAARFSAAFPC